MNRSVLLVPMVLLGLSSVSAVDGPSPLPPLGPDERPLALDPADGSKRETGPRKDRVVDREGLIADFSAMLRVRDRVRSLLASGRVEGIAKPSVALPSERAPAEAKTEDRGQGEEQVSRRLGEHKLAVRRYADGSITVTARVANLDAELVYRELATLLARPLDDHAVEMVRRPISLNVTDLAWESALDRILGQVNLAWRTGKDGNLVVFDLGREERPSPELRTLAEQAFRLAARDADDPRSAEAIYRIAKADHELARSGKDGNRYWTAMERYLDVIERFDRNSAAMAPAAPWVRRSLRSYGEALFELKQYRDARGIFLNYIGKSEAEDHELPQVYLQAAEASRLMALESAVQGRPDVAALTHTAELMQALIARFQDDPAAADAVTRARIALGRLLFERGDLPAAKAYLEEHRRKAHDPGDQVEFLIAECDLGLAAKERELGNPIAADARLKDARERYQALADRQGQGRTDPLADPAIYRTAAFRIGECAMRFTEPDFVQAIFAFLRAQKRFRDTPVEGELLVHMARCYAELESHDQQVQELRNLLATDRLRDDRPAETQLNQLLGDIRGNLSTYPDPIAAKVLFYIAQADYAAALRDPLQKQTRLGRAIHGYERVLGDHQPSPALSRSCRIGLARAALEAGDAEKGVAALVAVLRENRDKPSQRDVMLAAQMLGDHYRSRGRLDLAIKAYQAQVEDIRE